MTKSLNSRQLEDKLYDLSSHLQEQGKLTDAAWLEMLIFETKGYLPNLLELYEEYTTKLN